MLSAEPGTCTAHVEGARRGQECYCMHYIITHYRRAKIILVDFNLAVSTPTAKLPNLIPCQIFWLCILKHHITF